METNFNILSIWDGETKARTFFQRLFFRRTKEENKPLSTPKIIGKACEGIVLGGKTIKSVLFSTDMALIENNDADAVLAVYPFAPSPKIMKALIDFSDKPVICGVGGGLTQGKVAIGMAIEAEALGAAAIIVNQPFKNEHIAYAVPGYPVMATGGKSMDSIESAIESGADAIVLTPPSSGELFKNIMDQYRKGLNFLRK